MHVRLWGTRGSISSAGAHTVRFGGETSSVEVRSNDGALLLLDAGSGIRGLGAAIADEFDRVDVLLTHLHMDHIVGLGFFPQLHDPEVEVHIWGPRSIAMTLERRLTRYLSPPLFPVVLRDLERVHLHELSAETVEIGPFEVRSDYISHPQATLGYRVTADGRSLAYMPDHEPALGNRHIPSDPKWTSGYSLAQGVDLLLHDAQYLADEYDEHIGWGHSTIDQTVEFAEMTGVGRLCTVHHDPGHSDELLEAEARRIRSEHHPFDFVTGSEGEQHEV
jgi:ribonuclease BN (tRNA processing enzyme)